ncbi:MAG: carbon-nitrogen hydrolase family protein [Deltaproteobacteria bacterium]
MNDLVAGGAFGLLAGVLGLAALRAPLLAWVALAPLVFAAATLGPAPTALGAAVTGALYGCSGQSTKTVRRLLPISCGTNALVYAAGWGAAAAVWPSDAWGAVIAPVTAVAVTVPLSKLGAPRYVANLLARTQEPWLAIVHIARLGSDRFVLLAMASVSTAVALSTRAPGAATGAAFVGLALVAFGAYAYRATVLQLRNVPRLRIAAVVADPKPPSEVPVDGLYPLRAPDNRATEALRRYAPHVEAAADAGARMVVLPEIAMRIDDEARATWTDTIASWARDNGVTIVAPYFDDDTQTNALAVFDGGGSIVARYEKQHPGPIEPPRHERTAAGPYAGPDGVPLHVVICVDLDYADFLAGVRVHRGLLAVPANDWPGFDVVHHATSVWACVMARVPLVRATGHGISSVRDASGRLVAYRAATAGAGTLVADVPIL